MITITLPEWIAWLIVVCSVLYVINECLGWYVHYLRKKVGKLYGRRSHD